MQMPLFKQAFLRTEKASIFYDSNFRGIVRQSSAMFMLLIINNLSWESHLEGLDKVGVALFVFAGDRLDNPGPEGPLHCGLFLCSYGAASLRRSSASGKQAVYSYPGLSGRGQQKSISGQCALTCVTACNRKY
jgi:hypothetical protein